MHGAVWENLRSQIFSDCYGKSPIDRLQYELDIAYPHRLLDWSRKDLWGIVSGNNALKSSTGAQNQSHTFVSTSTNRAADKVIQDMWVFGPSPASLFNVSKPLPLLINWYPVPGFGYCGMSPTSLQSGWLPCRLASIPMQGKMGDAGKVPSVGSETYLICDTFW